MTDKLIRLSDALEAVAGWEIPSTAIAALPAVTVGVKPEAALILAKEMQAIVAADRWKGRDLSAAPPEKWSHLRPETQQFWTDTATRILAALTPTAVDASQAADPAVNDDDGPCTCCEGTGITIQTERRCACQPAPDPAAIREAALREVLDILESYGAAGEAIADEVAALIQKGPTE